MISNKKTPKIQRIHVFIHEPNITSINESKNLITTSNSYQKYPIRLNLIEQNQIVCLKTHVLLNKINFYRDNLITQQKKSSINHKNYVDPHAQNI